METNLHNYLQGIADAIKEKTGDATINAQDFASKIASIEVGGGSEPTIELERKDVNFYDYEGTLLFSYTLAEAQALTELPTPKGHEGLIFQGWNWDYEDVIALDYPMDIGAMYITDDGKTRLYINIASTDSMNVPIYFSQTASNGVIINWGDGFSETIEGIGDVKAEHAYANIGDYKITLEPIENCILSLHGSSTKSVMGTYETSDSIYLAMLYKVEFGKNVQELRSYTFNACVNLISVSLTSQMVLGEFLFRNNRSLVYVVFPKKNKSVGRYIFQNASSLEGVSFPKISSIGNSVFSYSASLKRLCLPNDISQFDAGTLGFCTCIRYFRIPEKITKIGSTAFAGDFSITFSPMPFGLQRISSSAFEKCYAVRKYDFSNCEQIPTLDNANAFTGISTDCKIVVPDSLYDEWISATNWSTYADRIIKASEYGN